MKAVNLTVIMSSIIYLTVAFTIIYIFGPNTKSNFMNNLFELNSWQGETVRVSYLILIICHIPYIYFACKESALVIVCEIQKKSISKKLEQSIRMNETG